MPKIPDSKLLDIEFYIDAAQTHGEEADPEHEVGDLQTFLRVLWSLLPPEKRVAFAQHEEVRDTLDGAGADYLEELAKLS